jgi:hypothetical protein
MAGSRQETTQIGRRLAVRAADAFEAAGIILLTVAALLVAVPLGLAVAGLGALAYGFALDRPDRQEDRPKP